MKVLDVTIVSIEYLNPKKCRILFQNKYMTDIIEFPFPSSASSSQTHQIPCSTMKDENEVITVSLVLCDDKNDVEQVVGTQILSIPTTGTKVWNEYDTTISFKMEEGCLLNATIQLKYIINHVSILDSLQKYNDINGNGFGWNICSIFLPILSTKKNNENSSSNNTVSDFLNLKLRLYDKSNGSLLASGKISSKSTSYFIPMIYSFPSSSNQNTSSPLVCSSSYQTNPIELEVIDRKNQVLARFETKRNGPALYCIQTNDMIVYLSIQSLLHRESIPTIIHSISLYDEVNQVCIDRNNENNREQEQIYVLHLLEDKTTNNDNSNNDNNNNNDNDIKNSNTSYSPENIVNGIISIPLESSSSNSSSNGMENNNKGPQDGFYVFVESKPSSFHLPKQLQLTSQHIGFITLPLEKIKDKITLRVSLLQSYITSTFLSSGIAEEISRQINPTTGAITVVLEGVFDNIKKSTTSIPIKSSISSQSQLTIENQPEVIQDIQSKTISDMMSKVMSEAIFEVKSKTLSETSPKSIKAIDRITVRITMTIAVPINTTHTITTLTAVPSNILSQLVLPSIQSSSIESIPSGLDIISMTETIESSKIDSIRSNNVQENVIENNMDGDDVNKEVSQLPNDSAFIQPMIEENSVICSGICFVNEKFEDISQIKDDEERDRLLATIEKLQKEVAGKDLIIGQLQYDNSSKDEAIRSCSKDIRLLRNTNDDLQSQFEISQKKLIEYEKNRSDSIQVTDQILHLSSSSPSSSEDNEKKNTRSNSDIVNSVGSLSMPILQLMLIEIVNRYQTLKQSYQSILLKEQNTQALSTKLEKEYQDLLSNHRMLLEAHRQQSLLLQSLQEDKKIVDKYKQTITLQEKVIFKMQGIIETKLEKSNGSNSNNNNSGQNKSQLSSPKLLSPIIPSNQSIESLDTSSSSSGGSNSKTFTSDDTLHQKKSNFSSDEVLDNIDENISKEDMLITLREFKGKIDELEAEIVTRDIRIDAMTQHMEQAIKKYATEITRLRTKLRELEIEPSHLDSTILYPTTESNITKEITKDSNISTLYQKENGIVKYPSGLAMNAVHVLRIPSYSDQPTRPSSNSSVDNSNQPEVTFIPSIHKSNPSNE